MYDGEIEFRARYEPKEHKWKVLVDGRDCFVVEDAHLGKAMAQAILRLEDVT